MTVDSTREMERTPLGSTETLRVRCPHCRKLYLVQFSDIQEAKPRFECVQCHSRFWLSLSEMDITSELQGIPLSMREAPISSMTRPKATEPCPRCTKPIEVGQAECSHCGVVVEKFKRGAVLSDNCSAGLSTAWKKLIAEYGNEDLHNQFIRAAQRERNLAFAAAQYGQMNKLMPQDEVTERRLREVQALASAMMPSKKERPRVPRRFPHLWQLPLIAAAAVIIVGMVFPVFRNMVGVGAALVFFAIALRIQFRERS